MYRARGAGFLGRFTFDDPQFTAYACPLLIASPRVSLIRGYIQVSIKRRYLFPRRIATYGLRSLISARCSPRFSTSVFRPLGEKKKCYETRYEDPSRIAGEIPIAPLSESSATGTSTSVFDVGPVSRSEKRFSSSGGGT